jgi:hypothetical protein
MIKNPIVEEPTIVQTDKTELSEEALRLIQEMIRKRDQSTWNFP